MKKLILISAIALLVSSIVILTATAQEPPPGFWSNVPEWGSPPQERIEFYENELQKCYDYLDDLSLGINKAKILFGQAKDENPHPFAGFGWSMQISKFEEEVKWVCWRVRHLKENIQEQKDKLPPPPSPTPTPTPGTSPAPAETKSKQTADPQRNEQNSEHNEQVKFIKEYRQKFDKAKSGADKILKEIDDYAKKNNIKPPVSAESNSSGGLSTITFNTPQGRIIVNLPADMKAGDAISGTVSAEPSGPTVDERAKNLAELNRYQLKLANETLSAPWGTFRWTWTKRPPQRATSEGEPTSAPRETGLIDLIAPISNEKGMGPVARQNIPEGPSVVSPNKIELPAFGQNGRPGQIRGPFDGNSSTTEIRIGGQPVTVIAESPRGCIFKSPEQDFGPAEITVKENNVETKGPYRNLGVRLSAPKTNLLKGEQTTVTITVTGLNGIKQNVPLLLEKKGNVSMEQGDVQTVQIKPDDVVIEGVEANVKVRRVIIGLRPGFFNITGTVIDPRLRPIIIPLIENGGVNGYRVKKDGTGFVVNVENVKHPITGDPVDGEHKFETGCPTLSKLPYISRLFLNKGVGKATSECLIMITPRIIIQEEQE